MVGGWVGVGLGAREGGRGVGGGEDVTTVHRYIERRPLASRETRKLSFLY